MAIPLPETLAPAIDALTPRQIVAELDKYVIGQKDAKRAVAIALRNRMRRQKLAPELAEDVVPKNILMIGPTGVGQDRDRAAARAAGAVAVHQGRGVEVHRGRLRRPRRRVDGARSRRAGRRHGARRAARRSPRQGRAERRRAAARSAAAAAARDARAGRHRRPQHRVHAQRDGAGFVAAARARSSASSCATAGSISGRSKSTCASARSRRSR